MISGTLLARTEVGRGGGGGCLAKVFGQFCARNLICLGDTLATLERTPRVAFQKIVAFRKTFAKSWHSIANPHALFMDLLIRGCVWNFPAKRGW